MTSRSNELGICYCGEYGGGAHTKSARCATARVTVDAQQLRFLASMADSSDRIGAGTTPVENGHLREIIRLALICLERSADKGKT